MKPWTDGKAALIGDAVHAMMPNLGQGGCQAIEDAWVLKEELGNIKTRTEIEGALSRYRDRRLIRSAAVQGLSRFASDIIIKGFDTPAKLVNGKIENFNYAGVVTKVRARAKRQHKQDTSYRSATASAYSNISLPPSLRSQTLIPRR